MYIQNCHLATGFVNSFVFVPHISVCATCPAHLLPLNVIDLIFSGDCNRSGRVLLSQVEGNGSHWYGNSSLADCEACNFLRRKPRELGWWHDAISITTYLVLTCGQLCVFFLEVPSSTGLTFCLSLISKLTSLSDFLPVTMFCFTTRLTALTALCFRLGKKIAKI
jgi:hypothetical protein